MLRIGENIYGKQSFPWPEIAGIESILLKNDRDFSSGNIGNWTVNNDGAGTVTYDATDIGGPNNKQGLLTSSGDTYLRASLSQVAWNIVANTLYKISAILYVHAGNTNKNVSIKSSNSLVGAINSKGTVTLIGDTLTLYESYMWVASDVIGGILLGFEGNPADGDLLYFDDISILPVDASWTPTGTNIIEIEDGALKVTYVDDADGAQGALTNLKNGEKYSIVFEAKGAGLKVKTDTDETVDLTASWVEYELVHTHTTGNVVYFEMEAGEIAYIKNIVVKRIVVAGMTLEKKSYSEDYLVDGDSAFVRLPWSEDYNLLTRQPLSEIYKDEDGEIYTRLDYSEDFQTETLKFVRQPNSENYVVEAR